MIQMRTDSVKHNFRIVALRFAQQSLIENWRLAFPPLADMQAWARDDGCDADDERGTGVQDRKWRNKAPSSASDKVTAIRREKQRILRARVMETKARRQRILG